MNNFKFLVLICFIPTLLHAEPIKDKDAIRAIIGEAANQGYVGMVAVADAIRNRQTLEGVRGFKSPLPDTQPRWVWKMAKKAWNESQVVDITHGASFWENTNKFGIPYWAKDMIQTVKIKDHVFYRKK